MKQTIKTFNEKQINIKDWWYVGNYYDLSEEDIIEIASIKEDKILAALSTTKGPVKFYKKSKFF